MSTALADMFGTKTPVETAARLEQYKAALDKAADDRQARIASGATWIPPHLAGEGVNGGWQLNPQAIAMETLAKSVSPEVLASLRGELAKVQDINKDISLASPLASGLQPFDLEAPAKVLAPVLLEAT